MSATRTSIRVRAMSLIELLCVIAIIAVLAALLLPAVTQAKARAMRIQCVDHLRQVGIGFVNFGNDHGGHFPMSVPVSAGGTLEYAQSGHLIQGDFYFSFRHFQAASNELVTPRLVVCPADTRPPATSFTTFSNSSLSYFVGVNAEFARPTSILAGDRNLTNDYAAPRTLVRLGQNYALRWTEELHRFKGNLLFSDGHVEERNSPGMVGVSGQAPAVATLALPTVRQMGSSASLQGGRTFPNIADPRSLAEPSGLRSSPSEAKPKGFTGTFSVARPAAGRAPARLHLPPDNEPAGGSAAPPKVERPSTNGVAATTTAKPEQGDRAISPFAAWLAAVAEGLTKTGLWWLYALLLLIAVATLALRKLARHGGRSAGGTHPRFR